LPTVEVWVLEAWAEQIVEPTRRLFSAWHDCDKMAEEGFQPSLITHRDRFLFASGHRWLWQTVPQAQAKVGN